MQSHSLADRVIRWVERIAGATLGLVTVLIVISSLGRYGFAKPVPDAFDLSRLILGVAIMWGFASLGYRGSHIKVDILAQAVPRGVLRVMNSIAWSVLLIFTALLVWKIFGRVVNAQAGGDATMDLRLPHWPFFAAIWAGLVAALFTTAWRLWLIAVRGRDLDDFESIDDLIREGEARE
ncbi:TRAP transporter small permease [Rhodosalinus halophilus]|jgi:TRAP-type C4-dicarboxylate transport system permease small subunit|uniref:TRAP transporter small permease protein n=1 Tax=Rhodosalinus halophilus TaxID=2259333 RepID=A0A365U4U0_9RHOB|nr:TRAP transporter small permease [Rhodosalinus halophilus]RBI83147.1 TRAP transporter small permease [Rhodosalinus halophilus]